MYKLDEELKNRLFFSYYYHPKTNGNHFEILNEEHGLNNTIERILDKCANKIFAEYMNIINNDIIHQDFSDKTFVIKEKNIQNAFVQSIDFRFNIKYNENYKTNFNASYAGSQTYVNKKDSLFGNIRINCNISQPMGDKVNINDKWKLMAILAHELTHALEDYKRQFNKKEKSSLISAMAKIGYYDNSAMNQPEENMDIRKLSWIMYHLTPSEINAYIAHLIKNIRPIIKNCDNSNDAWNIVKQSDIWKKYQSTEKYIEDLLQINNEYSQNLLLDYWNSIRKTNINDYNILKKILRKKWIKCRKKMVDQISKQITDIAMNNGNWGFMDGKIMNKTEL